MGGLNTEELAKMTPQKQEGGEYNPSVTPKAQATYDRLAKAGGSEDLTDQYVSEKIDQLIAKGGSLLNKAKNIVGDAVKYHRDASPTQQSMDAIESGLKQAEIKK